jgi:hypothetical protein
VPTPTPTPTPPATIIYGGWYAAGYDFSPAYPREISIWIVTDEDYPNPDNKISRLLFDELGVTLIYELTPLDQQEQRVYSMLVGGDYPDIIAQTDPRSDMIRGGSLICLDYYLDTGNYPLLQEHVRPNRDELTWYGGDVPDGLYILPGSNRYYGIETNSIVPQQGMGISVDSRDPGEILAFLEIMMTEYWQKALFWGIEGEDYLVDGEGIFYRTAEMQAQQNDRNWQASNRLMAFRDLLPKHEGYWPDGNPFSPFAPY